MTENDKNRLLQQENIKYLVERNIPLTELVTVYRRTDYVSKDYIDRSYAISSILVPTNQLKGSLSRCSWEMSDVGRPCAQTNYDEKEETTEYLRFGNDKGIEPLYLVRDFHDVYPKNFELAEEFRLFHNLYYKENGDYIKIDDDGDETIIAKIEENEIKVRLKEIRQFLAIKNMYMLIQFDYFEYAFGELTISASVEKKSVITTESCYSLSFQDLAFGEMKSNSRLFGKRAISPVSMEKSGFDGFHIEDKKYEEFIIDIDDNGEEVRASSNPENSLFLTPVFFEKRVLDKYYNETKYEVLDNRIFCANLWSLSIDNHHEDKVCVWLGDLGENLSYKEQAYWKSFNILPKGHISDVYLQRQLFAQFVRSEEPDHIFQEYYKELAEISQKKLQFQFLLPLHQEDAYCLKSLRIPATNEQSVFDNQIQSLTKILIDSINEKQLNKLLGRDSENTKGSINKLQKVLSILGLENSNSHIAFLRKLQNLRSCSEAHRKGKEYEKLMIKINSNKLPLMSFLRNIFIEANEFLQFLCEVVKDESIINKMKKT